MKYILSFLVVSLNLFGNASLNKTVTYHSGGEKKTWDGEKYDKNSSLQYRVGIEAVESFDLTGNERVLDIGCGNGKITALCASKLKSGSLLGIDLSLSMIEFANKNYGHISNLQFLLQDVTTMSFDQEFDFVYSIFCLHWVVDQETAIKNIAKSLKPGGKAVLYISIPNEYNKAFKEEFNKLILSSSWTQYADVLHFNHYAIDQEVWFKYAQQNNLSIRFKTMHDTVIYDDYQTFKQRVTAYGVCYEIIQILGQELGNNFVDCYLENIYRALGLTIRQPITSQSDAIILMLTKQ